MCSNTHKEGKGRGDLTEEENIKLGKNTFHRNGLLIIVVGKWRKITKAERKHCTEGQTYVDSRQRIVSDVGRGGW